MSLDYTTLQRNESVYGYTPTLYVCVLFVVLFSLSTIIHVAQAIHYRLWWLFPTAVMAGLAETLGWSARLWSSKNAPLLTPYLMQITTTIIAPTPLVAANFIILGALITRLGRQYSRLSPMWYAIIFCTFDVIALIVQAIGGASASAAAQQRRDASKGGNIMLGGIAFQMASITIYVACATEFLIRFIWNKPLHAVPASAKSAVGDAAGAEQSPTSDKEKESLGSPTDTNVEHVPGTSVSPMHTIGRPYKMLIGGLILSTLTIFIRSVYRVVELSDGWGGRIIRTQVYFNVLDGGMITIAMYTLNVFHPGRLL